MAVHTIELVPARSPLGGVHLHTDVANPLDLATWLKGEPCPATALSTMPEDQWVAAHGRNFDAIEMCVAAIRDAHKISSTAHRMRQGALEAAVQNKLPKSAEHSEAAYLFGQTAKAAETVASRLALYLERLMRATYVRRHARGNYPKPDPLASLSAHKDGAFARKTRLEQLEDVHRAALDLLDKVRGHADVPEFNQAYALLDAVRWSQPFQPPTKVELLREQVDWLCELVQMAYYDSFDTEADDSAEFTTLKGRKLPRPVSAAEIRAAIRRAPPPLIDVRVALAETGSDEEPTPEMKP